MTMRPSGDSDMPVLDSFSYVPDIENEIQQNCLDYTMYCVCFYSNNRYFLGLKILSDNFGGPQAQVLWFWVNPLMTVSPNFSGSSRDILSSLSDQPLDKQTAEKFQLNTFIEISMLYVC